MKTVNVLLTRYSDFFSNLLYLVSGFGYTHASIGFGEDNEKCYSFNYKGFCVETLEKHRRRGVTKSICYQLQISEDAYQTLIEKVKQFKAHHADLHYTRIGVVLCFFRIPFTWKKHYFCSQFVAELLEQSGALLLDKKPSLYLPNHFCRELSRSRQLKAIQYNVV